MKQFLQNKPGDIFKSGGKQGSGKKKQDPVMAYRGQDQHDQYSPKSIDRAKGTIKEPAVDKLVLLAKGVENLQAPTHKTIDEEINHEVNAA